VVYRQRALALPSDIITAAVIARKDAVLPLVLVDIVATSGATAVPCSCTARGKVVDPVDGPGAG
jgi:hypothetical protein